MKSIKNPKTRPKLDTQQPTRSDILSVSMLRVVSCTSSRDLARILTITRACGNLIGSETLQKLVVDFPMGG
jgi:hypothetical protein